VVLETVPRLATGDLDTVSAQAHEIARRVRPVILADIRKSPPGRVARYHLARVGVGLCAPGRGPDTRVIVSTSSVEGTDGSWTTKQRLILAAMAVETSRAKLPLAASTFALLKTPVTFLVDGSHRKLDVFYALLVDPSSGSLNTVIWHEAGGGEDPLPARLPVVNIFDSPMDVKASKVLGSIPVAWSFAVTSFPPGADLRLPGGLVERLRSVADTPAETLPLEVEFRRLVEAIGRTPEGKPHGGDLSARRGKPGPESASP
jgi:hypothetical protein